MAKIVDSLPRYQQLHACYIHVICQSYKGHVQDVF